MSCDDLTNASDQLKAACSCLEATETFSKAMEQYNQEKANHRLKEEEYGRKWDEYQQSLIEWTNKRNEHITELQTEEKLWNNCVPWETAADGKHDSWCLDDTGYGDHVGAESGGCTLHFGKGKCRRTQEQVESRLSLWEKGFSFFGINTPGNPKPSPPSGGTEGTASPCTTCNPPQADIICCSQIISDIQSGKNTNVNAIQECGRAEVASAAPITSSTEIKKKVVEEEIIKKRSEEVLPPYVPSGSDGAVKETKYTAIPMDNNTMLIIGGVVLLIIFIMLRRR